MSRFGLALESIRRDELIAYPTETVWGLGARATSAAALERLFLFKGRSADQPISVLVDGLEAAEACGARVSESARALAAAHWPGPLTLVLACEPGALAPGVARADGAVGFRCSSHPVAARLAAAARRAGVGPLTATSLNRSGEPPAQSRREAERLCGETLLVAFGPGPDAGGAAPSSVVDCTGSEPILLREAALDAERLQCRRATDLENRSA